jgi:hypothetical protein
MSDALGQPSILPSKWPSAAYKVGYEHGQRDERAKIPVEDLIAMTRKVKEIAVVMGAMHEVQGARDAEKSLMALRPVKGDSE